MLDAIGVAAVASTGTAHALEAGARALLEALRAEPRSRDELARDSTRSAGELDLQLLELQLEGLAAEGRDGRWEAIGPAGE